MSARPARVLEIPQPPPDRGRWLTVDDVCAMLGHRVSREWVYANAPHKVKVSHRVVGWWELDMRVWLEGRRAAS